MSDPQFVKSWQSKDKLQTQLNGATASGANDRVGGSDVRRRTSATERLNRRIVESEAVLSPVRIGEIGMIENIEKLGPELGTELFRKMPVLGNRKVNVFKSSVREGVAAHVAELPQGWREHNGVALGIATEERQRFG